MPEELQITIKDAGDVTIVAIEESEISSDVMDALLARRQEAGADRSGKLLLDLSKVKFIDSVALGGLVVLLRRVKEANGRLALAGLSGHAMKVLQVTGLGRVCGGFNDVSSALEALGRPG